MCSWLLQGFKIYICILDAYTCITKTKVGFINPVRNCDLNISNFTRYFLAILKRFIQRYWGFFGEWLLLLLLLLLLFIFLNIIQMAPNIPN